MEDVLPDWEGKGVSIGTCDVGTEYMDVLRTMYTVGSRQ
jgi:hypothetical protein